MDIIMQSERIDFIHPMIDYVDFYVENMNNPEIYRWITSNHVDITHDQEIEWIERNQETPTFTMINRENGQTIGVCGYNEVEGERAEMGIWITPTYQENGYGTEALRRIIEYGFIDMRLNEITLVVFGNNTRAIRCYRNLGFIETEIVENVFDGIGNETCDIHMRLTR